MSKNCLAGMKYPASKTRGGRRYNMNTCKLVYLHVSFLYKFCRSLIYGAPFLQTIQSTADWRKVGKTSMELKICSNLIIEIEFIFVDVEEIENNSDDETKHNEKRWIGKHFGKMRNVMENWKNIICEIHRMKHKWSTVLQSLTHLF